MILPPRHSQVLLAMASVLRRPAPLACQPPVEQVLPGQITLAESSVGIYEVLRCVPEVSKGPATQRVIVLTGNPGLAGFYADFASVLSSELRAEVVVLGLAGHVSWSLLSAAASPSQLRHRPPHGLDDQVAHLTEVVAPHLQAAEEERQPVTLIGHSIGAWLAFRVSQQLGLARNGASAAPLVLFLMPFLEENMSDPAYASKSRALRRFPFVIPLISRVAPLLRSVVPSRVRRWLLSSQVGGMEREYVRLVEEGMLHRGCIENYLFLARTEMFSHQATFATEALRPLATIGRLAALYVSSGDEWAPLAMERRLATEAAVPTTVVSRDEVSHAFSCRSRETNVVAQWVVERVNEAFPFADAVARSRMRKLP
jgi:pimeloyl-ACP methyl ester carboxylesterase